ncbi:MAG: heme o synthase, partial [Fimbriimonadaceae bacterium]
RLSFSGDGCGSHWPSCNGQLLPSLTNAKEMIEYSHRITSAIDGLLILVLAGIVFFRRKLVPGALIASLVALAFVIAEVIIGRGLVTFGWVAYDKSSERAVVLAVHLANTFILVGALALCAAWLSGMPRPRWKGQGAVGWALGFGVAGLLILGVSGAITSLGDKLFPVGSTDEAIRGALDGSSHFLVRLRILHPLIAVSVGVYLVLITGLLTHLRKSSLVSEMSKWVAGLFAVQILLGLANKFMLAPTSLSLIHLFVADAIWVAFIVWGFACVAEGVEKAEDVAAPTEDLGRATYKDYLILTKPRVISLLLFTTLTALFAASGGWPGLWLFLAVTVGGYMAAGAANAINMVIDRDIDASMKRTASRPTVTQKIPSGHALYFAFSLALLSFALLWWAANLLSAMLALAGLAFYVVVYTLMLKRRTWHNIVIGGAAGAFPPLVGWAAATNELTPLAWLLFAIIFVWTPVHFWALALMIKDDYAKANIPMLPVVHGERATVIQIAIYGVVTAVISILPAFMHPAHGPGVAQLYLWSAVVLNVILLVRCVQLYVTTDRPHALKLYKFSMLYLALLFLIFAIDCAIPSGGAVSSTQTTLSHGRLLTGADMDPCSR